MLFFCDFHVKIGTYVHKAVYSVQNRPREGELVVTEKGANLSHHTKEYKRSIQSLYGEHGTSYVIYHGS